MDERHSLSRRKLLHALAGTGVILSTVPVAVLFTFLQRHLIHGLTDGAVKG